MFRSSFLNISSTDLEKVDSFGKGDSSVSLSLSHLTLLLLDPKDGAPVDLPMSTHCIND